MLDQITRLAAQDVAQRGEGSQAEPFWGPGDEPVDLLARQADPALGQQRPQVSRGEHAVLGHQPAQMPHVSDPAGHRLPSPPPPSAS